MDKESYEETQYILEEFYSKSFDIRYGNVVGKTLKEKYYIESKLKETSKSEVYIVSYNNRKYIAKIILDKDYYEYIKTEKEILKKINNDSVVKFVEYFEETKIYPPILILEYIDGKEFNEYKKCDTDKKLKIVLKLLNALKNLEEKGIFHGDIKGENILIYNEEIKLIDFGISNISGKAIGTVKYMAPEVLEKGIKNVKTDIYSLSMLIYEFFYEYPYIGKDIKKSISWNKIKLRKDGDILFELIILKGLNKIENYRQNNFNEYLKEIKLIIDINELSKDKNKLEIIDFFKIINEEYNSKNIFLYHYYLSLIKNKVKYVEGKELDYILEYYLLSTAYRIPLENLELFIKRLEDIYVDIDKKELENYIKIKIVENLENIKFEDELSKVENLEKKSEYTKCIKKCKKLVLKGSREAEYKLGLYYKTGKGINKNLEVAIKYFENLSRIGYLKAYYQLNQIYHIDELKNYSKAFFYAEKGAKLGHLGCQNMLAIMYRFGQGTEIDMKKAFYWYEKASLGGHVAAQNNLGFMYKNGFGIEKNYVEAIKWYMLSAVKNNSSAQTNLAFMYREGLGVQRNYKEAVKWYKKAGENGSVNAKVNLGKLYLEGLGVEKDYNLALDYFKQGVEGDNEHGITNLAYMYEKGFGVEKNIQYAKELYEKAIQKGFSLAQYNYGKFLIESELKDYQLGLKYIKKSAKQKNVEAQIYMANLFLEGKVVEKSFVNSKKWYEIAIEEESGEAMYQLGKLYYEGKEVLQNYKTAFDYIFRSAKEGNIEGQKLLSTMYRSGYGVKKDLAEAKLWENLSGIESVEIKENEFGDVNKKNIKEENSLFQEKEIINKAENNKKGLKRKSFIKNLFNK